MCINLSIACLFPSGWTMLNDPLNVQCQSVFHMTPAHPVGYISSLFYTYLFLRSHIHIYIYIYTNIMYMRERKIYKRAYAYAYIYIYIHTYTYYHMHMQHVCVSLIPHDWPTLVKAHDFHPGRGQAAPSTRSCRTRWCRCLCLQDLRGWRATWMADRVHGKYNGI